MKTHTIARLTLILVVMFAVACGGDDTDEPTNNTVSNNAASNNTASNNTATGDANCTVSATITPDATARTVTGLGSVTCDSAAELSVETCVQWDPTGSFEDIQCFSSSQSGTTDLEVDNLASCGISPGRTFRARVNVTVDGEAQGEELSREVSCDG